MINTLQPLLGYTSYKDIVVYQEDKAISVQQLLTDLEYLDKIIPAHQHLLNLYENRYYFLLGLLLGIKRHSIHLFPSNITAHTLQYLYKTYPDILVLKPTPLDRMHSVDIEQLLQERLQERVENEPQQKHRRSSVKHLMAQPLFDSHSFTQNNVVMFTSGSTGEPKPFVKKWQDFIDVAQQLAKQLTIVKQSMVLATVPAQHMYGLEASIIMPLVNACCLYESRPFYPADIAKILSKQKKPCILISTPIHIRACLQTPLVLPFLEYGISATAPLDAESAAHFEQSYKAPLFEIYGCTEVGVIALRQPTQSLYWHCLDDIKIKQDNKSFFIHTSRSIHNFILNDYISDVTDNRFLLKGRKEDIINLAGKRTSLAYLNHHLLSIAQLKDGCFYQPEIEDDRHQRLVVFIVTHSTIANDEFMIKRLKNVLKDRIDTVFLPRKYYFVTQLPRNKIGKILYNDIKLLYSKKRKQC